MRPTLIAIALLLTVPLAAQAASLQPSETAAHVGQTATVCGTVASTHFAVRSRGLPTFLNMGHAYPHEDFTAVIWGENRAAFGKPEALAGSTICVTGPITLFRGKPEVVLQSVSQLHVEDPRRIATQDR